MTKFNIRSANLPPDYPAIAAVLAAESPGWGATADELAYDDAHRDQRYYHAMLVAETLNEPTPLMAGVAFVGHETMAHREGKFLVNLRVDPAWQGQGVGKALYQAVLDHLAPLAPQELHADVWQAHPRSARFLTERGFVEVWRRIDNTLAVTNFDFTPYAELEARLHASGITIQAYAELAADPDRLQKLYELDAILWQDVPYFGQIPVKRSLPEFKAQEVDHPHYLPEACFIAVKDGEFIGYSNLTENVEGLNTEMTGVLRAYRGQGVASLLKLAAIRYTQAQGHQQLGTVNDAVNIAVIRLNEKFGFRPTGGMIRFAQKMN
jgi:mycothiol synthase